MYETHRYAIPIGQDNSEKSISFAKQQIITNWLEIMNNFWNCKSDVLKSHEIVMKSHFHEKSWNCHEKSWNLKFMKSHEFYTAYRKL